MFRISPKDYIHDFHIIHLPDNKIWRWQIIYTLNLSFIGQNTVGKGEYAGYQHILLFPQCFQMAFTSKALEVVIVW